MPRLPKEFIAKTYRDLVRLYGRVIGQDIFARETGISVAYWRGIYWKSWTGFQAEQGFVPNRRYERYSDECLLRNLADLCLRLDRLPTARDMTWRKKEDPSFPSFVAYNRLARHNDRLMKLEAWCEGKPEFAPVAAMLERRRIEFLGRDRDCNRLRGFVYLARRSKPGDMIYEIGREIGTGKQLQHLASRLRFMPGAIHRIDTDDPEGVEHYWRRRFRTRRAGRSRKLFRLFPEDVSAFRWRRYQ